MPPIRAKKHRLPDAAYRGERNVAFTANEDSRRPLFRDGTVVEAMLPILETQTARGAKTLTTPPHPSVRRRSRNSFSQSLRRLLRRTLLPRRRAMIRNVRLRSFACGVRSASCLRPRMAFPLGEGRVGSGFGEVKTVGSNGPFPEATPESGGPRGDGRGGKLVYFGPRWKPSLSPPARECSNRPRPSPSPPRRTP